MLTIRKAEPRDAEALLELYQHHLTAHPPEEPQDMARWQEMLARFQDDPRYHLLVGGPDGSAVASATLVIVENLTHNTRPYAIVENVVTHREHRGRGIASALMDRAAQIAKDAGCYKIMLMTGSKLDSTLRFYERCGFNREDKTGFIRWIR